jgi:hypothetical protein
MPLWVYGEYPWITKVQGKLTFLHGVEETNRYAHQIRNSNNLKPNSRLKKWEDVSHEEMSAFLGLWLCPTMLSSTVKSRAATYFSLKTLFIRSKILRTL